MMKFQEILTLALRRDDIILIVIQITIRIQAWAKYICIHKYSNTFLKVFVFEFSHMGIQYSNTFVKNTKYLYLFSNTFQKYSYP